MSWDDLKNYIHFARDMITTQSAGTKHWFVPQNELKSDMLELGDLCCILSSAFLDKDIPKCIFFQCIQSHYYLHKQHKSPFYLPFISNYWCPRCHSVFVFFFLFLFNICRTTTILETSNVCQKTRFWFLITSWKKMIKILQAWIEWLQSWPWRVYK